MLLSLFVSLVSLPSLTLAFAPRPTNHPSMIRFFSARSSSASRVSKELLELFNSQVTNELAASQLYLSASIWCDSKDLVGMAKYMLRESDEERNHALAFIEFAHKRGMDIKLENIPAPEASWKNVEEIWADVLKSERENTQNLLDLGDIAADCKDHALTTFLQPFHMEQVTSEDNLCTILSKVREENRTPGLIRQLDDELGSTTISHEN
jgi:ferritin